MPFKSLENSSLKYNGRSAKTKRPDEKDKIIPPLSCFPEFPAVQRSVPENPFTGRVPAHFFAMPRICLWCAATPPVPAVMSSEPTRRSVRPIGNHTEKKRSANRFI